MSASQFLIAEEVAAEGEYFHKLTVGGGMGFGSHGMSDDMYDLTKKEVDRMNSERDEDENKRSTPEGYFTYSADLYADYFLSNWVNISFFSEALYGDADFGLAIADDDNDMELSNEYDMKRITFGLMPGAVLKTTYFTTILNAGVTYNNIHFMDYSAHAIGYRIKMSAKFNDDFLSRKKRANYIFPRLKVFMLFDRAYGKDHGVRIGSTGVQFGVEYNFYQI